MVAVKVESMPVDQQFAGAVSYLAAEDHSRLAQHSLAPEHRERTVLHACPPQKESLDVEETLAALRAPLPTFKALNLERCVEVLGRLGQLTTREHVVLGPLLQGLSNEEIADATQISKRGVKFHVSNILRKLRIVDRSQIIRFFF